MIAEALKKGSEILKGHGNEAPAAEAGALLCHVLKKDRTYLYTHGDEIMDRVGEEAFFRHVAERTSGKPLQYILGHQEFMSLAFFVTPDVLIPRQDTEILVETVLEHVKNSRTEEVQILDIGTGSGCIAVSLAYYLPNCQVTAVDISREALKVAGVNAEKAGTDGRITFLESDLFAGIRRKFDIIVSNPPYIRSEVIQELQREVRDYEPHTALDGGGSGLEFYQSIISKAPEFLKPSGFLAFEIGWDQGQAVSELMKKSFRDLQLRKDYGGMDRVVSGILCQALLG